jgi:hypothetical protein
VVRRVGLDDLAEEICVPSTSEGSIDSGGEGEDWGEGEGEGEDPTLSCAASGCE